MKPRNMKREDTMRKEEFDELVLADALLSLLLTGIPVFLFAYVRKRVPSILVQAYECITEHALETPRVLFLHRIPRSFGKARFRNA